MSRRFIAAAVCPKCKARDTIYLDRNDTQRRIFCADCDFSDAMVEDLATDEAKRQSDQIITRTK